ASASRKPSARRSWKRRRYVSMFEAMQRLGVTRQTVLQRVKRGELDAIHIRAGRRKALRIKVEDHQQGLFEQIA
ncbi:MAG: hypothetical protein OXF51_02675, partial [Alphaproteobacteria bacterium]|nr:hypothetical protein [Alphaproteobacteria bacterium]